MPKVNSKRFGTKLVALGERLLLEPAAFHAPEELAALMREHGVEGTSDPVGDRAQAIKVSDHTLPSLMRTSSLYFMEIKPQENLEK